MYMKFLSGFFKGNFTTINICLIVIVEATIEIIHIHYIAPISPQNSWG